VFLVDPDGGANVQNKLQAAHLNKTPEDIVLVRTIPDIKDSLWSTEIYKAPKVTFSSIFQFLVDRKILEKKANSIENVIERRDYSDLGIQIQGNVNLDSDIQGKVILDTACYFRINMLHSYIRQSILLLSRWPCTKCSLPSHAKYARLCLYWCLCLTINEEG